MKYYQIQAIRLLDTIRMKDIVDRINIKPIEASPEEMKFKLSDESYFFIYKYGTIAFFNVLPDIRNLVIGAVKVSTENIPTTEDYSVIVDPTQEMIFNDKNAIIPDLNPQSIRMICMIIAQSTALDYYENLVEDLLVKMSQETKILKDKGKFNKSIKELTKFIAFCLTIKQDVLSSMYILEFPDETWEDEKLREIYSKISFLFEITNRYKALDHKLKIIANSIEMIINLMQSKKNYLLEFLVVILFTIDIIIILIQWIFGKG